MLHDKAKSRKTEDDTRNNKNKEYGGFLTTLVKPGDMIFIGDSVVIIKVLKNSGVIISIRAPIDEKIVKRSPDGPT